MNSDKLTSLYMDRMRNHLKLAPCVAVNADPFIQHYSSATARSVSKSNTGVGFSVSPETESEMMGLRNLQVKSRVNVSDRNLLCMSVKDGEIVVGGADHGLRVVKKSGTVLKSAQTLYSKKFGHSDWVTAVEIFHDGRIVSGGMDSKICVWRGVQCKDLLGHVGSISAIKSLGESHILSSSYDRSLKIWNINNSSPIASLHGHKGAIIDCILSMDNAAISAGRDGNVFVWDVSRAKSKISFAAHTGHVTGVSRTIDNQVIVSGGHDGFVRFWDTRSPTMVHEDRTTGGQPITIIDSNPERGRIVSVSASSHVSIIDCRKMTRVHTWTEQATNHVYSTRYLNDGVLLGTGNGMIVARTEGGIESSKIQADQNAIRCIHADKSGTVVVATDDGNVIAL